MNVAKWKDVWRRFSGQGAYPHELAAILLIPLRRIVLSPEKLIPHLHLVRTSRILEVGPGPGFFSVDVAQAVPQGRLELVDIQREMLLKARRRLQRAGVPNVGYTQATAATLPFQSRTFDIAFLVAVLGEVPDPKASLNSIADVLRPDGLLVVAELPGDPDALAEEQLRDLTQGTGLEFVESVRISRSVITSFRRRANDPDMRAA
jgi:ubiquinone/menaquinone biosynthesis C-methylase UbiE